MEDTDISSYCSEVSLHSELSNTSSLSIYKAEFLELNHELDASNNQLQSEDITSLCSHLAFDDQQKDLCEKDKRYLHNLEKKLELRFHSQIELLIRHKSQLEAQLESAHKQISRLIDNYKIVECGETSVLKRKIMQLESGNLHLYTENANLLSETGTFKSRQHELEAKLHNIKTEINEKKDLVKVRDVCIEKLKIQVSQQCVEIQKLSHINNEVSQKLLTIQSELQHCKKSDMWYREQLLTSQDQKKQLLDELSQQKNVSLSYFNQIHQLNLELSKCKNKYEESCLEIIKNRKYLLQNHNSETVVHTVPPVMDNSVKSNKETDQLCNQYQQTIKELAEEMKIIQKTVLESQIIIKQRNKENSELTAQCIKLQKLLQSKENEIEHLQSTLKRLVAQPLELTCQINTLNKQLLDTRADNHKLKVELKARNQEKDIIENTVSEIRDNFTKLKTNYEKLKIEINLKDKHIIQLQTEKQELFMNNNWKICELEKIKNNDSLVNKLKEHIHMIETEKGELLRSKTDILERYDEQRSMLEQELDCVKTQMLNVEDKCRKEINECMLKIDNYEAMISKYQNDVTEYQNEITNLKLLKMVDGFYTDKRHEFTYNLASLLCDYLKSDFTTELNVKYIQNIITKSLKTNYFTSFYGSCDQMTSDSMVASHEESELSQGKNIQMFQINSNIDQSHLDMKPPLSLNIDSENHYLDSIRKLQALVQVKEMEKKHAQYKNETNNRTLLRKVKEHMKGRHTAEKCNVQLQALCESLSYENKLLKIKLVATQDKPLPLAEQVTTVDSSFHELSDENMLSKFFLGNDNKNTRDESNIQDLENIKCSNLLKHKQMEQRKLDVPAVQLSEITVSSEKDNISKQLECKNEEIKKLRKHLMKMKSKLVSKKQTNINLQNEFDVCQDKYEQEINENNRLQDACKKYEKDIECLKKEIESINRDISQKCEQLKQSKQDKESLQGQLKELQGSGNTTATSPSIDIDIDSSELDSLRNEKFFLQRLCNDLKAALRSNIDQNMALKERISHLSQEQQFSSLPNILPSLCVPSKLDEEYIQKLLSKSKTTVKPLSDIQKCLESLKKEVFILRKQVEEDTCKRSISFC